MRKNSDEDFEAQAVVVCDIGRDPRSNTGNLAFQIVTLIINLAKQFNSKRKSNNNLYTLYFEIFAVTTKMPPFADAVLLFSNPFIDYLINLKISPNYEQKRQ